MYICRVVERLGRIKLIKTIGIIDEKKNLHQLLVLPLMSLVSAGSQEYLCVLSIIVRTLRPLTFNPIVTALCCVGYFGNEMILND